MSRKKTTQNQSHHRNKNSHQLQQQNYIYSLLPQARPLHTKTLIQPLSIFPLIAESAPVKNYQHENSEQLQNVGIQRNQGIHQIGYSLSQLFRYKVYQSYQQLQTNQNNMRFAICNIEIKQKMQTIKVYDNQILDDNYLIFESKFESGNLAVVSRSQNNQYQYYLALQRDTNSLATCQWYYFYVENRNNLGIYTFNIVNMLKNYSAYQNGMKPCVYSKNENQNNNNNNGCWKRSGFNIMYKKNSIPYNQYRNYYTFQFSYNFNTKNDRVYFAYCYPYTYTKLQNFIYQIQNQYPQFLNVKMLGKSLLGNPINILSITNSSQQQQNIITNNNNNSNNNNNNNNINKNKKDLILITARVHPGQTNSSYACQSLIQYLLGNSEQANNLRNSYIIKIIPFLNPDGVIHGNYRTSIAGCDLNRKWKKQDKDLHPQIYSIKKYLYQTNYNKMLYIDLHGHSKKKSSFMYGCFNRDIPYLCKQFPFIMSKNGYQFCYFNCNFSTPISREGTSRLNMWKQFGVDYSYTMEISFCGPIKSKLHFKITDFLKMGKQLAKIISVYFCGKKQRTVKNIITNNMHTQKIIQHQNNEIKQILKQFYNQQSLLNQGGQQTQGSQSEQDIQLQQKKQQKNNKQNSKQIKGLLTKYLNESKIKWTKRQNSRQMPRNRKQQEQKKQANLRNRRQFHQSRLYVQQLDLVPDQISSNHNSVNYNYNFYNLSKGSPIPTTTLRYSNKQLVSRQFQRFQTKQTLRQHKKVVNKITSLNNYRPYSYSKNKIKNKLNYFQNQFQRQKDKEKQKQLSSLILPKVLKQQDDNNITKYRKYKKNYRYKYNSSCQYKYQKMGNLFEDKQKEKDFEKQKQWEGQTSHKFGSRAGNYSTRQISLAQKMLRISDRQISDTKYGKLLDR